LVMVTGYNLQDPNREDSLFLMLGAGFEYNL
jgi:hypothetical protein